MQHKKWPNKAKNTQKPRLRERTKLGLVIFYNKEDLGIAGARFFTG